MKNQANVRALAAKVLLAVMDKGQSLSDVLPLEQQKVRDKDVGLLQEICFGAIRYFPQYDEITRQLLDKKLKGKQRVFHHLIIVGLYQIDRMRIPEHAAVGETVQAAVALKAPGIKGLINGVLRNFVRNQEKFATRNGNPVQEFSHPSWFIKRLQNAYPEKWREILAANLDRAPMWLRVQESNQNDNEFVLALADRGIELSQPFKDKSSILLSQPKPVPKLPGFEQGWFSVQDAAAQQAANILSPKDGDIVFDACAAPGGKTCHLLDLAECSVYAADVEPKRLERLQENLARLKVTARVICADLTDEALVAELPEFDRILLDAPCSATGVIRRHPDIKWLRRDEDIEQLAALQYKILQNLWKKLKPGGTLLYATCSILPQENSEQMARFFAEYQDAKHLPIEHELKQDDSTQGLGWQILPGEHNMDGFYYCLIEKLT